MTNAELIAKIKTEIERLKGICTAQIKANPGQTFPFVMEMTGYDKLLSFLDTLESEKPVPNDLEEAAKDYTDSSEWSIGENLEHIDAAFIAGAEWQAEQLLKSSPLPEDTVLFNKGVEEGKRLMMEEAVEGTVMDFSSNRPRPQVAVLLDPHKYHTGDKVRVIIVKE